MVTPLPADTSQNKDPERLNKVSLLSRGSFAASVWGRIETPDLYILLDIGWQQMQQSC